MFPLKAMQPHEKHAACYLDEQHAAVQPGACQRIT